MKTPCIDAMTLYDFALNRLGETDRTKVENHLAECDFCLAQFVAASELLNDEKIRRSDAEIAEVRRPLLESVLSEVRQFFRWTACPNSAMPATALVRRGDSVRDGDACKKKETDYLRLRKTLGGVRFELIWQKAADDRFDLEAVLAQDATDSAEYSLLAKRIGGAAAGRVFQDGRAFFERLSFGDHELVLERAGVETGRYRFRVGPEGIHER